MSIDKTKETPQARYDKTSTRHYAIKAIKNTEADIIAKLDSVPNKAGYIKSLIRKDLADLAKDK